MDPDQVTSAEETRAISPPNNGMKRERSASDDEEERRVLQRKDTSWTESNDIKTNVKAMVRLNSKTILTQIMVKMRTTLRQPIPDDHQVFHRVGGSLAVVTAMEKYPDCELLQRYGVAVLGNAARDLGSATMVAEVDGIQAIATAMKRFPSKEMHTYGVKAIFNLSTQTAIAKVLVLDTDAVTHIINAMNKFQDSVDIVRKGCYVLNNLSRIEDNKKPLRDANVRTALAAAMDGHKDDEEIQECGWGAMKRLSETA